MAASDHKRTVMLVGGAGDPSGVPTHIRQLTSALEHSAEVTLITDLDRGGYAFARNRPVVHHQINGLATPIRAARAMVTLAKILRGSKQDLFWLHARWPIILCRFLLLTRLWRPTGQVCITLHGLPFGRGHHPVLARLSLWLERFFAALCPPCHLVFLTPQMRDTYQHNVGTSVLKRHKTTVLPNSTDIDPLPPRSPIHPTLVMTGRTGRQKDYETALRLFARLDPSCRLVLAGPGTDTPAFQRKITHILPQSARSRVTCTGPVCDVRPLLAQATAYLLTSRYEGMPIGLLEAMVADLPVVLRDFDGARQLIQNHGKSLLLDYENPVLDAPKLNYFLRDCTGRSGSAALFPAQWSPGTFQRRVHRLLPLLCAPPVPFDHKPALSRLRA